MESETLSHIHVVAKVDDISPQVYNYPSTFYSFIFDIQSPENIDSVFQFIFSEKNKHPFTLTLEPDKQLILDDNSPWLDKLYLILCHPNYIKYNNKIVIGVVSTFERPNEKSNFSYQLNLQINAQGFSDVSFVSITSQTRPASFEISYVIYKNGFSHSEFCNWYLKNLTANDSILNIFAFPGNEKAIEELVSFKHEAEQKLFNDQPQLYQLIQRLQSKAEEINEYEQLVRALTEDLSSKKDYLDFLLGKFKEGEGIDFNEIMKIKRFYYREYEVLPLWYKRFGHILKVITGKRTLKSLFDDNAKKRS